MAFNFRKNKDKLMPVSDTFKDFLSNIKISSDSATQISNRYQQITRVLNLKFRDSDSLFSNCLQVGSYGRWTAIEGISDLDMLYILPSRKWDDYNKKDGQSKLLKDTKDAILLKYPRTTVFVDRLVVCVQYANFHIEVQPVFKQDDGSYKYPDTYKGGSWKVTKPQDELDEISKMNQYTNRNLRRLCKMARAWKNKHGIAIGGLLIDTLAYNFFKTTDYYDDKSYTYYDYMSRDFFKFLSKQPNQSHYQALGSNQDVRVNDNFQDEALKAYNNCLKAIKNENKSNSHWRRVFGNKFPDIVKYRVGLESLRYRHTEEFIEQKFSVDIRFKVKIACEAVRVGSFSDMFRYSKRPKNKLNHGRNLTFSIQENTVPTNYDSLSSIYWKVLNKGEEAMSRDCVRGQIIRDTGTNTITESSSFNGEHEVECYVVQNRVVVARDKIYVPIEG